MDVEDWLTCTQCKHHKLTRNRFVYDGPDDPLYVFVGEAPTAEDDIVGEFFTGKFDKLLKNLSHTFPPNKRRRYGKTYALACCPWTDSQRLYTKVSIPEIKVCSPHIAAIYAKYEPLMFALGNNAVKACNLQNVPNVALPSIAAILSSPVDFARFRLIVTKEIKACPAKASKS